MTEQRRQPTGWKSRSRRRAELPSDWQTAVRPRIFARDKYTCQLCGISLAGRRRNQVDHIGDRNDHRDENLRALCYECHKTRTSRQGGRTQRKPRPRTTRLPEPHPGLRKQPKTRGTDDRRYGSRGRA